MHHIISVVIHPSVKFDDNLNHMSTTCSIYAPQKNNLLKTVFPQSLFPLAKLTF